MCSRSPRTPVLNELRVLDSTLAIVRANPSRVAEILGPEPVGLPRAEESRRYAREVERVADALERSPEQADAVIAAYEGDSDVPRFYKDRIRR